jgi:hypothetical protein
MHFPIGNRQSAIVRLWQTTRRTGMSVLLKDGVPMLSIPPVVYRRRKKLRAVAAGPGALVITGIAVLWLNPEDNRLYVGPQLNVTAENPLVDVAAASGAKWWARYEGMRFSGIGVTQTDVNQIEIEFDYVEDDQGPNVFAYTNDPSDIGDTLGRFLAAFEMGI